jgi:hypothetical protein
MKNYITECDVAFIEVVKMLERWALRGSLCNDKNNKTLNLVVPKERPSFVSGNFHIHYGGEKITLLTKVKKGWGKGRSRKVVFFKQRNTFENLTWMENNYENV